MINWRTWVSEDILRSQALCEAPIPRRGTGGGVVGGTGQRGPLSGLLLWAASGGQCRERFPFLRLTCEGMCCLSADSPRPWVEACGGGEEALASRRFWFVSLGPRGTREVSREVL